VNDSIRKEFRGILVFVGAIWAVFLLGWILPWDVNALGLRPRKLTGLTGVPLMPFLHANLKHLASNTFPLVILLLLLAGSRAKSWQVVVANILLGGGLLWLFGRPMIHVGASGLIYGLIAFLIVSGFMERRPVSIAIALLVAFFYGGTLLSGIIPDLNSTISWDGHFLGAVAGGLIAAFLAKRNK
jgi:membrane associated rhomboid family serine protease